MNTITQNVEIPAVGVTLQADVEVPEGRRAWWCSRTEAAAGDTARESYVAQQLQNSGLATALADLLTPAEEEADARGGQYRFDIDKLSARVIAVTDWLLGHEETSGLGVGLFGASTGAGAALVAAAARPSTVDAVVSRGGRPDLAGEFLRLVHQPTLLIVGRRDATVLELNREAAQLMPGETRLDLVPGATHLFEEAGALEQVSRLARDWFLRHLERRKP